MFGCHKTAWPVNFFFIYIWLFSAGKWCNCSDTIIVMTFLTPDLCKLQAKKLFKSYKVIIRIYLRPWKAALKDYIIRSKQITHATYQQWMTIDVDGNVFGIVVTINWWKINQKEIEIFMNVHKFVCVC